VVLGITDPPIEGIAFVLPNKSSKKPLGRLSTPRRDGQDFFEVLEDGLKERIEGSYSVQFEKINFVE